MGPGSTQMAYVDSNGLTISGRTYCNGRLNFNTNVWNYSSDGKQRIYFQDSGRTYFQGYGTPTTRR